MEASVNNVISPVGIFAESEIPIFSAGFHPSAFNRLKT